MRHIILINAHNNLDFLLEQLLLYDKDPDFYIYVHWDRKTVTQDIMRAIYSHKSVKKVCSQYSISWGGRNLLESMILICSYALQDLENEGYPECFIHTISGSNILIRSIDELKGFFNRHKNMGFMEYFRLPSSNWQAGGLKRLTLHHPLDKLNIHDAKQAKIYNEYIKRQEHSGQFRPLPPFTVYGGGCWWSITRDMAIYWVKHYNEGDLFDRLKDTFGPEEIHPQTILLNSPFRQYICNSSLNYICWDYETRGTPAILENFDLPYMIRSNNIWARKIAPGTSDRIKLFYEWFSTLIPFRFNSRLNSNDFLQQITEYICKHYQGCPLLGVMDGLMGIAIYLFCYGKVFKQEKYTQTATTILNDAIRRREEITTSDFNNGTIGFAYSLAWLLHHGFIMSTPIYEELLSVFDKNTAQILNDKEKQWHFQTPFGNNYFCIIPYIKLRNLHIEGYYPKISNENMKKLLKPHISNTFKQSLGMSGIAGIGYCELRALYKEQVPSFLD